MFGIQFYPTPPNVASKMVEPYRELIQGGAIVLDPSAGKGDLLQAAQRLRRVWNDQKGLYAVEIDPNLQEILKGKYSVVGDDWMQYSGKYHYDLIIMNPPFAAGTDHLLKAWDVIAPGGHIACLLNQETIDNPYTQKRELLAEIIAQHGSVENLGNAFSLSERRTDVDVALVRLKKPAQGSRFHFEGIRTGIDDKDFAAAVENLPARRDLLSSLVSSYEASAGALERKMRADSELNYYTSDFWRGFYHTKEMESIQRLSGAEYYNAYLDLLRRAAWHQVFSRTNWRALMTERARADFETFQKQQGQAEFTVENVNAFFALLVSSRDQILEQCVLDVFDRMTSYDKKNTIHFEGWKTNSAYKVNRKVIIPYVISNQSRSWGNSLSVNHSMRDRLDDFDRAMCLVSGKRFEDIQTTYEAINEAVRGYSKSGGECGSEFFDIKYFIKGTAHFTFRDEWIWQEFNRRACKGKGWIGDGE